MIVTIQGFGLNHEIYEAHEKVRLFTFRVVRVFRGLVLLANVSGRFVRIAVLGSGRN